MGKYHPPNSWFPQVHIEVLEEGVHPGHALLKRKILSKGNEVDLAIRLHPLSLRIEQHGGVIIKSFRVLPWNRNQLVVIIPG